MKHRIEKALANLFKMQILREQIESLQEETEDLLLVSEIKRPESVRGVDLGKLAELGVKVEPTTYVGHKAAMEGVEVSLHTFQQSGTVRIDPRDEIFKAVYAELGSKKR